MEAAVVARKKHGMTHAEIAHALGIEKGTVDSHSHRARKKYSLAYHTEKRLRDLYDGSGEEGPDPAE